MIKNYRLLAIMVLFVNIACTSGQNKKVESTSEEVNFGDFQENAIVGNWKNLTINVDLETYNNSDTSFRVSITEDNWKLKMNIDPIVTEIYDDGTFLTNYRDTLSNIFHQNKGTWYIDGDSLYLEDQSGELFPYQVYINGNRMEMKTMVDYDEDGKKDDFYQGEYIRVKK